MKGRCLFFLFLFSILTLTAITYAKKDTIFSHKLHSKKKISCEVCHNEQTRNAEAIVYRKEVCLKCHQINNGEEPDPILASIVRRKEVDYPFPEIIFSHIKHNQIECSFCHSKMQKILEHSSEKNFPVMTSCISCHKAKKITIECQSCHRTIRDNIKPQNHDSNWLRKHGMDIEAINVYKSYSNEGNKCLICHTISKCKQCHQEQKPLSHTLQFTKRGHSIIAGSNKDRCKVCHYQDFCTNCHQKCAGGVCPL